MPSVLASAYHTSIIIDDKEYSFNQHGISAGIYTQSHQGLRNKSKTEMLDVGVSYKSGADLCRALAPFFREGSYDLLRKNCNSFSACAVSFLLGGRLQDRFQAMERLAADSPNLVQIFTLGDYKPNAKADHFNQQEVCEMVSLGRPAMAPRGMPAPVAPIVNHRSRRAFETQTTVMVR